MTVFIILSTLLFALLCFIWKSNHWLNVIFKMTFFAMMVFGIYEIAKLAAQ